MRERNGALLILIILGYLFLPSFLPSPAGLEAVAHAELGGSIGDAAPSFPVIKSLPSGAATYSIPIEVPPGRGKIVPHLALTYNSYQRSSWVGVGLDLEVGAIQRATKKGINYAANNYVLTANGSVQELVPRGDWGANCYGARIEGTFSRYFYNTTTGGWEVTAKDGTRYYYGTTAGSRQDNAKGIYSWQLDRVQDTNGNYMTLTYFKDQGEIYLSRIDYTGNGSISPSNAVVFNRENRTDVYPSFASGSEVKTAYRLHSIEVRGGGQLARKYELTYDYSASTGRSLLRSIK